VAEASNTASAGKDIPGVIAPPPLIYLAALILGVILDLIWPVALLAGTAQYWVGGVVIAASFALVIPAFRGFRGAGEHPDPWRPTSSLVLTGPYRVTRNPMYLAMTVLSIGLAIVLDNVWILLALVPALIVTNYGVIRREERYLEAKFGEDYIRFKSSVRRWI
jgi:protein-S-isoprenylcysteine O-methyltransferase Ste14